VRQQTNAVGRARKKKQKKGARVERDGKKREDLVKKRDWDKKGQAGFQRGGSLKGGLTKHQLTYPCTRGAIKKGLE